MEKTFQLVQAEQANPFGPPAAEITVTGCYLDNSDLEAIATLARRTGARLSFRNCLFEGSPVIMPDVPFTTVEGAEVVPCDSPLVLTLTTDSSPA